ncbi:MAG: leucine-rich repeat domain-containing protein [Oscillospiraceae bacterium]
MPKNNKKPSAQTENRQKKRNLGMRITMLVLAAALAIGILTLPISSALRAYAEEDNSALTVAEFETGKLDKAISEAADGTDYNFITKIAVLSGTMAAEDWNALTAIPNLEFIELAGTETKDGKIPDSALPSRNQLTYISLPKNTTEIGKSAFSGNRKLEKINMPTSVNSIGDYAFEACEALAEIPVTENVTYIGEGAFRDCKSITSFTIPSKVTEILPYTFSKCGFSEIIIGPAVTSVGDGAFADCGNLKDIYVYSENAPALGGSGAFLNLGATIHVYDGCADSFSSWEINNVKVAEDLTGEYPAPEEVPAETEETAATDGAAPVSEDEQETKAANESAEEASEETTAAETTAVTEEAAPASASGGLSVGVTVAIAVMAAIIAVLATILVMSRKKSDK